MSALLKKKLQNRKITMSLTRAFEKLSKIKEVTIEYPAPKRSRTRSGDYTHRNESGTKELWAWLITVFSTTFLAMKALI